MKVGFLSDAHGNLIALEKCLNYLFKIKVDKVFFLGDAIGYYPKGIEVLELLKRENIHCLLGNHEAMLLGNIYYGKDNDKVYQLDRIKRVISSELIDFIKNLSPHYDYKIENKSLKLMHGGPSNFLTEYIYPDTQFEAFSAMPHDLFFMGHTHYPFIKVIRNQTIVNVGSCGMPRDYGKLSSFAVLDTLNWGITILRIEMHTSKIKRLYCSSTHKSVFDLYDRKPINFTGNLIKE
jgi:putative phosphoesterase